jgi:hypothetical protein
MTTMSDLLLVFLGGFALESISVFWVHTAQKNLKWRASGFSALQACALLSITECTNWPQRIAFVAGYTLGSAAAIQAKQMWKLTG